MDPDQLNSEKPADLDLHCFQNRRCPGLACLELRVCKAEKKNMKMIETTYVKTALLYFKFIYII